MELLWFTLAGYGLTQILVYSSLFEKPRTFIKSKSDFLGELVSCPMCTGFWVGALLFCLNPFTELFSFELNAVNFLICGWLGSGSSYVMNMVFGDKGMNFSHNHNEPEQHQKCEHCDSDPYHRMSFDEMGGMFEYHVGEDDEE